MSVVTCSKCGSYDILIRWHPGERSCRHDQSFLDQHYGVSPLEHLHLRCRCCQYLWIEPTKDKLWSGEQG